MTLPLWLVCLFALPALVGAWAIIKSAWLVSKHVRKAKLRQVPGALRTQPKTLPLLDEPPAACPELDAQGDPCSGTVLVARRAFTGSASKDGDPVTVENVEHFVCNQGHRWLGQKQRAMLQRRIVAKTKLAKVKVEHAAELETGEAKLKAKAAELAQAVVESSKKTN